METNKCINLSYKDIFDSMALLSGCGLLLVDHFKSDFLYVSSNIDNLYGVDEDEMMAKGCKIYDEHVAGNDLSMFQAINKIAIAKFESYPEHTRRDCSISYDFSFEVNGKLMMINHRIAPIATKDNKLWLSLCFVSQSFSKASGNIILRNTCDNSICEYNLTFHKWVHKTSVTLSDKEKHLLHLVSRGFSNSEIAEEFIKSEETVKSYRKALKKKLGSPNLIAALLQMHSNVVFQT